MKKGNLALAALLILGIAVLTASLVLVVSPQMKSGTAVEISENAQSIQEEIQQRIDQYTETDLFQNSIVKESLERTQEIIEEAQKISESK